MDELIGNLITYELKKNQEIEIGSKRKEKNLALKLPPLKILKMKTLDSWSKDSLNC